MSLFESNRVGSSNEKGQIGQRIVYGRSGGCVGNIVYNYTVKYILGTNSEFGYYNDICQIEIYENCNINNKVPNKDMYLSIIIYLKVNISWKYSFY